MHVKRSLTFVALIPFALSCGSDSSAPQLVTLVNPAAIAEQFSAVGRAAGTPHLQNLGALAIPAYLAGIEVFSITPLTIGRTYEWNPETEQIVFNNRPGAPADGVRLILYSPDPITGLPAVPLVEIGYADLFPYNDFNGGGPDSITMRYIVTDTRTTPTVVANFFAHSHFDGACLCATVDGWASDGTTRVDFVVPYSIVFGGHGTFRGDMTVLSPSMQFRHVAALPGAGDSTASLEVALAHVGDSLTLRALLTQRASGLITGGYSLAVNDRLFANVDFTGTDTTATGPNGRQLSADERHAVEALFAAAFGIAFGIEWPTLVLFYCGC